MTRTATEPGTHVKNPARVAGVRLYMIAERAAAMGRDLASVVDAALSGIPRGAAAVQLREKDLPTRPLVSLARELCQVTKDRGCPLLINDRLDIALAVGASGVHLPERGLDLASARRVAGPDMLIGVSTHSPERAVQCALGGADLVLLSPIWATPKKRALGVPLGLDALTRASRALAIAQPRPSAHLFALGGVTSTERASQAVAAGAHGVAGIRWFMAAQDPSRTARDAYQVFTDRVAEPRQPGSRDI